MAVETQKRIVTPEQYTALVEPIQPPTPEDLFEYQVEKWHNVNLMTYEEADPLRSLASGKRGLFLIVPRPPEPFDLKALMALIEWKGRTGVNYLNIDRFEDLVPMPRQATLLVDVEDGRRRLSTKSSVSREKIKTKGRVAYTTFRGIVHAIVFPWTLAHHNLDLVGSRYGLNKIPYLRLLDGSPVLNSCWQNETAPDWGAPSCGAVLGA